METVQRDSVADSVMKPAEKPKERDTTTVKFGELPMANDNDGKRKITPDPKKKKEPVFISVDGIPYYK